jgi:DNA-binding transcriptional LysR family regulator
MTRGDIDLNLLIVFDAVMQERSLTRAGNRLGLSQPATSHALARLRAMLRDDLFVRTPEGMQPTPRAQQMGEPVRDALRVLRVTLEPEAFDPAAATRSFTLAVNNYAASAVVPTLARLALGAAPGVTLHTRPVGMLNIFDQLDRGADVALATLVDGGERFKCVRIMEDDFVAMLDREHPATRSASFTPELLAEIPNIQITSSGDDTRFVDEQLEARGLARRIAVAVPMLSIVLTLVGSDHLVVLPRRVGMNLARVCPVVLRNLPFPSPRISLAMIWPRRLDNHPAQRWLRQTVQASVRDPR